MRGSAVTLAPNQRGRCSQAIVEKLSEKDGEVLAVAVAGQHVHIQARLEDQDLRRLIGLVKQHASHRLREELPGKVWGARCSIDPVRTKEHQTRLFRYIVAHQKEGAFVWTYRDAPPRK